MKNDKSDIIRALQRDILRLQGVAEHRNAQAEVGLGVMEKSFPNGVFPLGGIHEFVSVSSEDRAASSGFISGILGQLMQQDGVCFWISTAQIVYPPALDLFGISPERIVFVHMPNEKQVLWAIEEALKCKGLVAVIGEVYQLSFVESRRLQLAVEQSRVTGFILRRAKQALGATACVARWKIRSAPSVPVSRLPGLGYPRWEVNLLKVRNGQAGQWIVQWNPDGFQLVLPSSIQDGATQTSEGSTHRSFGYWQQMGS